MPESFDAAALQRFVLPLFTVPEPGAEVTVADLVRPLNGLIDLFDAWAPDNPQDALGVAREIHLLWLAILQAFYGDDDFYARPAVAPERAA